MVTHPTRLNLGNMRESVFSFASDILMRREGSQVLERFLNDCRKPTTSVIIPTNHNRSKQRDEPIRIPRNCLQFVQSAGEIVRQGAIAIAIASHCEKTGARFFSYLRKSFGQSFAYCSKQRTPHLEASFWSSPVCCCQQTARPLALEEFQHRVKLSFWPVQLPQAARIVPRPIS